MIPQENMEELGFYLSNFLREYWNKSFLIFEYTFQKAMSFSLQEIILIQN